MENDHLTDAHRYWFIEAASQEVNEKCKSIKQRMRVEILNGEDFYNLTGEINMNSFLGLAKQADLESEINRLYDIFTTLKDDLSNCIKLRVEGYTALAGRIDELEERIDYISIRVSTLAEITLPKTKKKSRRRK